jgi:hypothetical protein
MFGLSTSMNTTDIPAHLFVKKNWEIETITNETKLFIHANHPSNIDAICKFALDLIYSGDSLSELIR